MRVFFVGIVLLSVAFLPGCNRLFGIRQEMRMSLSNEPKTLDWVRVESPEELFLLAQFQRPLLSGQENKKELADSWSVDASQKRYTFSLGTHFWCDGVALTSHDFVHAWERHLAPGSKSKALPALLQIRGATDFHLGKSPSFAAYARTDRTLEVQLEKPSPTFLKDLTSVLLGPQRRDVFLAFPQAHTTPLHLRTIGPYQPFDWVPGESLLMVSNSYYPSPLDIGRVRVFFGERKEVDVHLDFAKLKSVVGDRVLWAPEVGFPPPLQFAKWR